VGHVGSQHTSSQLLESSITSNGGKGIMITKHIEAGMKMSIDFSSIVPVNHSLIMVYYIRSTVVHHPMNPDD
jgi:hypothetical protein